MSRKKLKPSNDTLAKPPEEPTVVDNEEEGPPPVLSTLTAEQIQRAAILATIWAELELPPDFFTLRYMRRPNVAERLLRDEGIASLLLTLSEAKSLTLPERHSLFYALYCMSCFGTCVPELTSYIPKKKGLPGVEQLHNLLWASYGLQPTIREIEGGGIRVEGKPMRYYAKVGKVKSPFG